VDPDENNVDDQAATVAADTAAGSAPASSQDDDADEPTRRPWRRAWATAGALVLGAVLLVAVAGIVGWAIWPSAQPSRPAGLGPPTATKVPVQVAPPTVASPSATAAPESPPAAELPSPSTNPQTPTTPIDFTAADDQRLFTNLQQYGYPIADPENIARVAHTYCHALQRGESSEQADAEAAALLANPADETAITAAASLALPHCNS
jgi:uncharacterized iron-regulated membrane protein